MRNVTSHAVPPTGESTSKGFGATVRASALLGVAVGIRWKSGFPAQEFQQDQDQDCGFMAALRRHPVAATHLIQI